MSTPVTEPAETQAAGDWESSRRDKLQKIAELGHDPWGSRFDDHAPIADIRARAGEIVFRTADGRNVTLPDLAVGRRGLRLSQVALRARARRDGRPEGPRGRPHRAAARQAASCIFIDIRDMTGQIQLFIGQKQVGDDWQLAECFDLGDIIGVDGELRRTKTGELSIFAERLTMLSKSLAAPPEKHHGLTDPELRQRMRYLDLTYGEGVMPRFLNRTQDRPLDSRDAPRAAASSKSKARRSTRSPAAPRPGRSRRITTRSTSTSSCGSPSSCTSSGCWSAASSASTSSAACIRNEGISQQHNPEFTMLEAYQAYGDYRSMMDLTEACIVEAIRATGQPLALPWGDKTIDFTPPFARKTYDELFAEHAGVDPTDAAAVAKLAKSLGLETAGKHPDVIKSEVFEAKVEDALVGPIFVMDYPASICPLTKRKADNPHVAERFELIVARHGNRQRLHRAERPRPAGSSCSRRSSPAWPTKTRWPRWTTISSAPCATACRPPAASASASTAS